jgi:hypothetical protein
MGRACSTNGKEEEEENAYKILVENNNIKTDLREIGWDGLAHDGDQWTAQVNTVMNFRVP